MKTEIQNVVMFGLTEKRIKTNPSSFHPVFIRQFSSPKWKMLSCLNVD